MHAFIECEWGNVDDDGKTNECCALNGNVILEKIEKIQ